MQAVARLGTVALFHRQVKTPKGLGCQILLKASGTLSKADIQDKTQRGKACVLSKDPLEGPIGSFPIRVQKASPLSPRKWTFDLVAVEGWF